MAPAAEQLLQRERLQQEHPFSSYYWQLVSWPFSKERDGKEDRLTLMDTPQLCAISLLSCLKTSPLVNSKRQEN